MILLGAILAAGRPNFDILGDGRYATGYNVRLKFSMSHKSLEFLEEIERQLMQQSISCSIYKRGNTQTLHILKKRDLLRLAEWLRETKGGEYWLGIGKWKTFLDVVDIYNNKEHLTQEGMDKLMKMKGLI